MRFTDENIARLRPGKNGKPLVVPTAKTSDSEIYNGTGPTGIGGAIGTTTAPATTTTGAGAYTKKDSSQQNAVGTVNVVSTILCETVTTGKCLIGLICGSTRSVTQNRTTYVIRYQATPRTPLIAIVAEPWPPRNRSHSSTV